MKAPMPERILIDTDPGIDDAMAILLALASPEVQVEGVTVVFGNSGDVNLLARNASAILELAGHAGIPVAVGAASPLVRAYHGRGSTVHGENGLGDIELPPPTASPIAQNAAQFIIDTCLANPGEITLVTLGPLTNIALALRIRPDLPRYVRRLVMMGGAIAAAGNVSPVAEANVHNDPEAARLVFNAGWEITMAGLDVTMQVHMDDDYLATIRELGNRSGQFIWDITRFYVAAYHRYGYADMVVHDSSALMAIIRPEFFTSKFVYVDVETSGELTRGQTIGDWRRQYGHEPQTHVLTGVDDIAFKQLYYERIATLP
jgi:inosine-uridine nucleoside N-ribohydrolase